MNGDVRRTAAALPPAASCQRSLPTTKKTEAVAETRSIDQGRVSFADQAKCRQGEVGNIMRVVFANRRGNDLRIVKPAALSIGNSKHAAYCTTDACALQAGLFCEPMYLQG